MGQVEWDEQFRNKFPSQSKILDFMHNELSLIGRVIEPYCLNTTVWQKMVLWESLSASKDCVWIKVSNDTATSIILDFMKNPDGWWRRYPYCKSFYL